MTFPRGTRFSLNLASKFLIVSLSMPELNKSYTPGQTMLLQFISNGAYSEYTPQAQSGPYEIVSRFLTNLTRQAFLTVNGFIFFWATLYHGKNFAFTLCAIK